MIRMIRRITKKDGLWEGRVEERVIYILRLYAYLEEYIRACISRILIDTYTYSIAIKDRYEAKVYDISADT